MLDNLLAEMARKHLTSTDIANTINKNQKTARDKVNERGGIFTVPEALTIRDTHFPGCSLEYLFTPSDYVIPKGEGEK